MHSPSSGREQSRLKAFGFLLLGSAFLWMHPAGAIVTAAVAGVVLVAAYT